MRTDSIWSPGVLTTRPLGVAGSHDTGSYFLDVNGPFAPDQSKDVARLLAAFGCLVRPIVHRWSITQGLTLQQQLEGGIRYLDLRISSGPLHHQYSIVHGLYGVDIKEILETVKSFCASHLSEVFIIDINHLYAMSTMDHQLLLELIITTLGPLLVPFDGRVWIFVWVLCSAVRYILLPYKREGGRVGVHPTVSACVFS